MPIIVRLCMVAALMAAAACASSTGGTSGNRAARVEPPVPLGRTFPELVAPRSLRPSSSGRPTTIVELSVLVNADGTPDMSTLKIAGPGAAENRDGITRWVQGLRFKPAQQAGQPVPGTYKTSFSAATRVRVVPG